MPSLSFRVPFLWAALAATTVAGQPEVEAVPPPSAGPVAPSAPAADIAYALGYRIGGQILADHEGMGLELDRAALARGLADAANGAKPAIDEARCAKALAAFEATLGQRRAAFAERMREAARTNLTKGREFLAANAGRPGVVSLPSGLQYEVVKTGTGVVPGPTDVVTAHYRGTRIDGSEFDATDRGGEPARFALGDVIPGWREALQLMKVGSTWKLWIPADLAYGSDGAPPAIQPNEVLAFEIELVGSRPPGAADRP